LNDDVGALQPRVGVIEEMPQHVGRCAKWQRADDSKRLRRECQRQKVRLDDADSSTRAKAFAQPPRPVRVRLDRDDAEIAAGEGIRHRAKTGADLDNELTGPELRSINQAFRSCGLKKVLTEPAPTPVPGGPPVGGHGRSP
jgi:hypothetical protein